MLPKRRKFAHPNRWAQSEKINNGNIKNIQVYLRRDAKGID